MWIAANGDKGVRRAARIGDGWLVGPHSAIEELKDQTALFRQAWADTGKPGNGALVMVRECFVAPTREEAVAKARPCLDKLYRDVYVKWGQDEAMTNPDELTWDFDRLARHRFILGSPEDCIEEIRSYEESLKPDLLLLRFDWTPGLEQRDILAAMDGRRCFRKLFGIRELRCCQGRCDGVNSEAVIPYTSTGHSWSGWSGLRTCATARRNSRAGRRR